MNNTSLIDILEKYQDENTTFGTDKNSTHSYGQIYEMIFNPIRNNTINILEIGYDGGFFSNV
jgi:hypothetical protein